MKRKLFLYVIFAILITACEDETGTLYEGLTQTTIKTSTLTRSAAADSIYDESLVIESMPDKMLRLQERINQISSKRNSILKSNYDSQDQWFSSNIYAIRELPITIKVRGVASGSNSNYSYLSCSGPGKEVTLSSSSDSDNNKFFLKVLPAYTGIPYLIYSEAAKTPLSIGHYNNTPSVKILMTQANNDKLSDFAAWDLIASQQNKGYFSIQNIRYIGQFDESNPMSIFYYNVEAIAGNKLGFAQPIINKPQQEFEILTCDKFSLSTIEYDLSTVTINTSKESHYGTGQNLSTQEGLVNVNFIFDADETSNYNTSNNSLKVNLNNSNVELPWVSGGSIMQPGSDSDRPKIIAPFSYPGYYHYHRRIQYTMKRNCPGRHNIQILAHFIKYNVSIKFTAKAYFTKINDDKTKDERMFVISGTWYGTLYEDPTIVEPTKDDPIYTKIGEEALIFLLLCRKIYLQ